MNWTAADPEKVEFCRTYFLVEKERLDTSRVSLYLSSLVLLLLIVCFTFGLCCAGSCVERQLKIYRRLRALFLLRRERQRRGVGEGRSQLQQQLQLEHCNSGCCRCTRPPAYEEVAAAATARSQSVAASATAFQRENSSILLAEQLPTLTPPPPPYLRHPVVYRQLPREVVQAPAPASAADNRNNV